MAVMCINTVRCIALYRAVLLYRSAGNATQGVIVVLKIQQNTARFCCTWGCMRTGCMGYDGYQIAICRARPGSLICALYMGKSGFMACMEH
jgi:hypothetical protein